jgi:DNA-binding NtrC family response regulator
VGPNEMMPAILIIEQDTAVGQLFVAALEGAGYTVYLALNRAEAYELLHRVEVQVLITDLNLPRGSGLELVAAVRDDFPGTKMVAISGEASEFDPVQAAPLLDTVEVLPNPVSVSHLLDTVQRVLACPGGKAEATLPSSPETGVPSPTQHTGADPPRNR